MTSKQTQFVVLCEDKQQEVFARKYLEARNINRRKITYNTCPSGKQSGEQYVRTKFAEEVKTLRRKQRENRALLVIIDADIYSVANRMEQLDQHLAEDSQLRRQNHDRIGIFVPKRNIETWISFAAGESVDETTIFPKLKNESDCAASVKHLASTICPQGLATDALPSLHVACDELKRIL